MRFVTPVFFAAASAGVHWYNGSHAGRVLVLPFMNAFAADAPGQGRATVGVLLAFAVVFAAWDGIQWALHRNDPEEDE